MPKKRIPHKGKAKTNDDETEETPFRETEDEEYINVVDYESNKKYNKRQIESNWSKYETSLEYEEETNTQKTDDFTFLLQNAPSDYSLFQFRSEKQWDTEDRSVLSSEIFNLDLNMLSKGLACLPFHERIGLEESELSKEDKLKFENAAANNRKDYEQLITKLKTLNVETDDLKSEGKTETPEDMLEVVTVTCLSKNKENVKTDSESVSKIEDEDLKEVKKHLHEVMKTDSESVKNAQKIFFNTEDENLEDWLDSVLDD